MDNFVFLNFCRSSRCVSLYFSNWRKASLRELKESLSESFASFIQCRQVAHDVTGSSPWYYWLLSMMSLGIAMPLANPQPPPPKIGKLVQTQCLSVDSFTHFTANTQVKNALRALLDTTINCDLINHDLCDKLHLVYQKKVKHPSLCKHPDLFAHFCSPPGRTPSVHLSLHWIQTTQQTEFCTNRG